MTAESIAERKWLRQWTDDELFRARDSAVNEISERERVIEVMRKHVLSLNAELLRRQMFADRSDHVEGHGG